MSYAKAHYNFSYDDKLLIACDQEGISLMDGQGYTKLQVTLDEKQLSSLSKKIEFYLQDQDFAKNNLTD